MMSLCLCGVLLGSTTKQADRWTPARLSGLLSLWLDAADLSTLYTTTGETTHATNGMTVGRWKDKSGNNRHADQATASKKPTVLTNDVTSIRFDGGDGLATPSLGITGQQVSIYCIASADLSGSTMMFFEAVSAYYTLFATGLGYTARLTGNVGNSNQVASNRYGSFHRFAVTYDMSLPTDEVSLNVTNGLFTYSRTENANNTGSFADQPLFIGSRSNTSLFLTGQIGEIVIANSILSPANDLLIKNYLSSKWGVG